MTIVAAPVPGRVIGLGEVNDPVFSGQMMGPGLGIDPDPGRLEVIAPVSGRIVKVHPHAIVLQAEDGTGLLVHLGINTVQLNGAGFEVLVADGDRVTAGQGVIGWDTGRTIGEGISNTVIVVALERPADSLDVVLPGTEVAAGDALFTL